MNSQTLMSVKKAPITVMKMRPVRTQLAPFCVFVIRDSEAMDNGVKVSPLKCLKRDKFHNPLIQYELQCLKLLYIVFLDIDECMEDTDDCDKNAMCENNPGSFECICNEGFEGSGQECDG